MDEELLQALAMSVNVEKGGSSSSATTAPTSVSSSFIDPAFVSQLLGSVDQNDPLFQAALAQLQAGSQPKNEEEKKKDGDAAERGKKRKGDDK